MFFFPKYLRSGFSYFPNIQLNWATHVKMRQRSVIVNEKTDWDFPFDHCDIVRKLSFNTLIYLNDEFLRARG